MKLRILQAGPFLSHLCLMYVMEQLLLSMMTDGCWHTSAPLPLPCGLLSAAVMDNTLVLLGGFSNFHASCRVLSADLIKLSFHSHSTCTPTRSPWESIPSTPLLFSTALSLKGALEERVLQ